MHCVLRPAGRLLRLARGAYTGIREHDKGTTRLREITTAARERMLAYQPNLKRSLGDFFNILIDCRNHMDNITGRLDI